MSSLIIAFVVCVVFAIAEGIASGPHFRPTLENLRQPRWSLPPRAWYFVGVLYYGVLSAVVFRLVRDDPHVRFRWVGLTFLFVLLAANAAWNAIFFRLLDFELAFWYTVGYSAFCVVMETALFFIDPLSALIFLIYVLYLPYALVWTRCIKQLNSTHQW